MLRLTPSRMLRSAACVAAIALVTAGGASAEVVARSVQDGFLALDAKGVPSVAWVPQLDAVRRRAARTAPLDPNGGGIGSAGIERGGVRDRRSRACRARPERRRPHDRTRPPALGGLADDPGGEGRRALPARLARPRARWEGPRGARLHALECPDARRAGCSSRASMRRDASRRAGSPRKASRRASCRPPRRPCSSATSCTWSSRTATAACSGRSSRGSPRRRRVGLEARLLRREPLDRAEHAAVAVRLDHVHESPKSRGAAGGGPRLFGKPSWVIRRVVMRPFASTRETSSRLFSVGAFQRV